MNGFIRWAQKCWVPGTEATDRLGRPTRWGMNMDPRNRRGGPHRFLSWPTKEIHTKQRDRPSRAVGVQGLILIFVENHPHYVFRMNQSLRCLSPNERAYESERRKKAMQAHSPICSADLNRPRRQPTDCRDKLDGTVAK
mmetsp:Transcript_17940/g.49705  ORF Transcript_17940/g.49705 Transcript_17940/m.49705 type:complete len:139 (-) Transcript_17940:590-1006(-)